MGQVIPAAVEGPQIQATAVESRMATHGNSLNKRLQEVQMDVEAALFPDCKTGKQCRSKH